MEGWVTNNDNHFNCICCLPTDKAHILSAPFLLRASLLWLKLIDSNAHNARRMTWKPFWSTAIHSLCDHVSCIKLLAFFLLFLIKSHQLFMVLCERPLIIVFRLSLFFHVATPLPTPKHIKSTTSVYIWKSIFVYRHRVCFPIRWLITARYSRTFIVPEMEKRLRIFALFAVFLTQKNSFRFTSR